MSSGKDAALDACPNPLDRDTTGDPSDSSRFFHTLTAVAVSDDNSLVGSQHGEPNPFELQQGENWIQIGTPSGGRIEYPSISPLESEHSHICVDVDRNIAAIKDTRARCKPEEALNDDELVVHLSRRIRKRDQVEDARVDPCPKQGAVEIGGYDTDDENDGEDITTRPPKHHAKEVLQRRRLRILHQGDRISLNHHGLEENGAKGLILEYRHHRTVASPVIRRYKESAVVLDTNQNGIKPALTHKGEPGASPEQPHVPHTGHVSDRVQPPSTLNSSGTTSASTSKAVIVPPAKGTKMEEEWRSSERVEDEEQSYLTGDVFVADQSYVSAITGDDETSNRIQNTPAPTTQEAKETISLEHDAEVAVQNQDQINTRQKSQEEDFPSEAAVSPPKQPKAGEIAIHMDEEEVNDADESSSEDDGDPTQVFEMPAGLSTQLSEDEKASDDETSVGQPRQNDVKVSLEEQQSPDPYDQPTQPLLLAENEEEEPSAENGVENNEIVINEDKKDVDEDVKPQNQNAAAMPKDNLDDERSSASDTSCNLLEDAQIDEAENDKPVNHVAPTERDGGKEKTRGLNPESEQPLSPTGVPFDYGDELEQSNADTQKGERRANDGALGTRYGGNEGMGEVHQVSGGAMMTGPVGTADKMNCAPPHTDMLPAHMKHITQNIKDDVGQTHASKQESKGESPGTTPIETSAAFEDEGGGRDDYMNRAADPERVGDEVVEQSPTAAKAEERPGDQNGAQEIAEETAEAGSEDPVSPPEVTAIPEMSVQSPPAANGAKHRNDVVGVSSPSRIHQGESDNLREKSKHSTEAANAPSTELHEPDVPPLPAPEAGIPRKSQSIADDSLERQRVEEGPSRTDVNDTESNVAGNSSKHTQPVTKAREPRENLDHEPTESTPVLPGSDKGGSPTTPLPIGGETPALKAATPVVVATEDSREAETEEAGVTTPDATDSEEEEHNSLTNKNTKKALAVSESARSSRKRTRMSDIDQNPGKRAKIQRQATNTNAQIRVVATGVKVTPRHKMMIQKIGGVLLEKVDDAADATHVIAGDCETPLRRTPKLMIGLCRTSNIVHMDWLVKSARARRALDCSDFLLLDEEAEKKYDFSMRKTLKNGDNLRRNNRYVLSGWYIYVCKGVAGNKAPPDSELRLIVVAAGGKWLATLSASKLRDIDMSHILVITSDPAPKKQISTRDVAKILQAGAHRVTTSWLFHCMISQELAGLD